MHSRTAAPPGRPDPVVLGLAGAAPAFGGRQPDVGRAPVHGALRDQHERRHRAGREHAGHLPAGHGRDPEADACANAQTGSPGDDNYFDMGSGRRRWRCGDVQLLERRAQRAGGRDRAVRRALLGRRARPGRDAADAVRPRAAAHGRAGHEPRRGRLGVAGLPGGGSCRSAPACSTPTPRISVRGAPASTSARATRPSPT